MEVVAGIIIGIGIGIVLLLWWVFRKLKSHFNI